jgi:hypothetical protein
MSTDQNIQPAAIRPIGPGEATPTAKATGIAWGNSAPLALAGFAFYLALAEVCEAAYGREILSVGHLARPERESLGEG